jgi:NADP-dependent 3-hydroxy acid dehydrogenase YdfG
MQNLSGKTVFITGGAGGIGMGMAKAFARAGMNIVLADVDTNRLTRAAADLREAGAKVSTQELDVRNFDSWTRALDAAETSMGPIAILCNNAGIAASSTVAEDIPDRWKLVLEVNALGPFYGCRAVLPRMLARNDEAHIVNTASLAGLKSEKGMSSYCASKYAVVGLSDSLRQELEGTRVGLTVVYPGMTNTGFVTNSANTVEQNTGTPITPTDAGIAKLLKHGMNPDKIGERVVRAVKNAEYRVSRRHPP